MIEASRLGLRYSVVRQLGWPCLVLLPIVTFLGAQEAHASERIALVIGNGDYAHAEKLDHVVGDMTVMADTLRSLDFDVEALDDLDRSAMLDHIETFADRIDQAGRDTIGLFFYAGHGFQLDGSNYLLPVDAEIDDLGDVEASAISLDLALAEIAFATNEHKLVILDVPDQQATMGDFGARPGFAVIDAPVGTLVAFGTLPGMSHQDLRHKGLYPLALANVMVKPDLMVEEVFQEVRLNVAAATDGMQVPWESSGLISPLYLAGQSEASGKQVVEGGVIRLASMDNRTVDLVSWTGIKDNGDASAFAGYLDRFPEGMFRTLAERRLEKLAAAEASPEARHAGPHIEPVDELLITQRRASVRAAPSSGGVIVATLEPNQMVEVTGDVVDHDWKRVRLDADVEAYIWKPLLGSTPAPDDQQAGLGAILPPSKDALLGQWQGQYHCQWDTIGFTLDISEQDAPAENHINAVFAFFPLPETPALPPGSFTMSGDYDPADGTLILKSQDWIEQPTGLQLHNLAGRAEIGGGAISGRIETPGCSDFYLARADSRIQSTVQSTSVQ